MCIVTYITVIVCADKLDILFRRVYIRSEGHKFMAQSIPFFYLLVLNRFNFNNNGIVDQQQNSAIMVQNLHINLKMVY
jgi:hypothetical protein